MASNASSTEATDTAAQTPPTPSSDLTKKEEGMLAAAWEEVRDTSITAPSRAPRLNR